MKNKDYYDLTTLDFYEEDEMICIYRIGFRCEVLETVQRYFDETPFMAFMRWLESDKR